MPDLLRLTWSQNVLPAIGLVAWYPLLTLDTSTIGETEGVYVIWKLNQWEERLAEGAHNRRPMEGRVIDVGQGAIADRLKYAQDDPMIRAFLDAQDSCHVTWAAVMSHYHDGVERYLANVYSPLALHGGARYPDAPPIPVTLPR